MCTYFIFLSKTMPFDQNLLIIYNYTDKDCLSHRPQEIVSAVKTSHNLYDIDQGKKHYLPYSLQLKYMEINLK